MKWFVVALVFLNAAFFGWAYNERIKVELANEDFTLRYPDTEPPRLMLLSETPLPPGTAPGEGSLPAAIGGARAVQELPTEVREFSEDVTRLLADVEPAKGDICISFGPIVMQQQAQILFEWARERALDARERFTEEQNREFFWIYLAPSQSGDVLSQTIRDLESKGIQDYRLISRGNLKNAISLGLFAFRWEVEARVRDLSSKGYHPLVVPYRDTGRLYWIDARFNSSVLVDELLATSPASGYSKENVACETVDLIAADTTPRPDS